MNKDREKLISVVIPLAECVNSKISCYVLELHNLLDESYENFEIILVAPRDQINDQIVDEILTDRKHTRCYLISNNASLEVCLTAGLDNAIGDYTIVLNPNEDPIALIPDFIEKVVDTNGIVIGLAKTNKQGSICYRFLRKIYFQIIKLFIPERHPANSTYYIALSRVALNALLAIKYKNRFIRVLTSSIGMPVQYIEYQQLDVASQSSKNILAALNKSVNIIVGNSTKPLKYAAYLGLLAASFNLLYIAYIFAVHLVKDQVAEGWTTNSLQNSVMFFCLFLILSVMVEYIARLFEESQDRPLYTVLEEVNSNLKSDLDNYVNVVKES